MKPVQTSVAKEFVMRKSVLVFLAALLLVDCNRGHDRQSSSGAKFFGERTLKDGTRTAERVEWDGETNFNETWLPDGTIKAERTEHSSNGQVVQKDFGVTWSPDGTEKTLRFESLDGSKSFDVIRLKNGTGQVGRVELSDGRKEFDVTWLKDGSERAGSIEFPDGRKEFNVILNIALLDNDKDWIALEKHSSEIYDHYKNEPVLHALSPEWNQIQAEINRQVASINDESLRSAERRRVSERLLPQAKSDQLVTEVKNLLKRRSLDYLNAHKDSYRVIAGVFGDNIPDPVKGISVKVEHDGVLSDKSEREVRRINCDDANQWSICEEIKEQDLMRLTVHEMDAVLTKFRDLHKQEILQVAAGFAPYSTMVSQATGSPYAEDAGRQPATPEQVRRLDASLKQGDRQKAESIVWGENMVLAAQTDLVTHTPENEYDDGYRVFLRKNKPIYLVDKGSETVFMEVPREAFCFKVEESVSQGIHGDYSDEHKIIHDCSLTPREQ